MLCFRSTLQLRTLLGLVLVMAPTVLAAEPQSVESCRFKPHHENGIYELGEKVGWTVSCAAATAPGKLSYAIRKNNYVAVQSGVLDLASGGTVIEIVAGEPGMLYVELTPVESTPSGVEKSTAAPAGAPAERPKPVHLGAAVAPGMITRASARPADFDAFWDAKLQALAEVRINAALTPTPTTVPGVELYTFKLDSPGSHVQGYLAKPAKEGKFPALMLYQWAGVYALNPEIAAKRAAEGWLAINVDSHDLAPTESTGVPNEYAKIGNASRETSYFLSMYLRDKRAIDYIASRPDWDGKTIVALGTSMGGHQSLAAAALDARVTAVIVNEPSGANTLGELYGYQTGYPNWVSADAQIMAAAPYFDTVNLAPRIKAPVLLAVGFIDTICPPAGLWMVLNQLQAPHEVIGMIESDHNNLTPQKQGAWEARSTEVLALILGGGAFLPNQR